MLKRIHYITLLGTALTSFQGFGIEPPVVRRALFDIGSSGTKLEVADVDPTKQKVKDVVLSMSRLVGYRSDLARQKTSLQEQPYCFTREQLSKGFKQLRT